MLKIVLILMIKNESKIVRRCIESIIDFIDAFCITDTGSSDNTTDIITDIIKESNKPGKLCKTFFQDFGTTRSESFEFTKTFINELGWNTENSFGLLLDADMVLKFRDDFNKSIIGDYDEYKIIQTQAEFDYNNTRLIRMSLDWKCIGSTHEYWQSTQKSRVAILTTKKMWIDDISDGGCKADKYERDIRLLNIDLEKARKEGDDQMIRRSLFYLAQTYMCIKDFPNAIKYFKQRVDLEGWIEEVWYSLHCIGNAYSKLNNIDDAIKYFIKAYETDKTRSESLYLVANIYSNMGQNDEAMRYIETGIKIARNPKNIMFTNNSIYEYGFLLSKFHIMLKITTTSKKDVLKTGVELLNKLPKTHLDVCENIIKIINDLSSPLDFDISEVETEHGIDYFIEPSIERVSTPNGFLSLEKLGASFILVEYSSNNKKYSLPFVLGINGFCRKFYRDELGKLTFVAGNKVLKLIQDPELN